MPTIAIDTHTGSDSGVRIAVRAAAKVSMTTSIDVLVVGTVPAIEEALNQTSYNPECLRIRGIDDPSDHLRVTMELVASGEADGMVTTMDPATVHSISMEGMRPIPGVHRAPMAAVIPTAPRPGNRDPFALVVDVGGQQECTADDLVCWARMGTAYARLISRVEAPTVGLLSTASDAEAGPTAVIKPIARWRKTPAFVLWGTLRVWTSRAAPPMWWFATVSPDKSSWVCWEASAMR